MPTTLLWRIQFQVSFAKYIQIRIRKSYHLTETHPHAHSLYQAISLLLKNTHQRDMSDMPHELTHNPERLVFRLAWWESLLNFFEEKLGLLIGDPQQSPTHTAAILHTILKTYNELSHDNETAYIGFHHPITFEIIRVLKNTHLQLLENQTVRLVSLVSQSSSRLSRPQEQGDFLKPWPTAGQRIAQLLQKRYRAFLQILTPDAIADMAHIIVKDFQQQNFFLVNITLGYAIKHLSTVNWHEELATVLGGKIKLKEILHCKTLKIRDATTHEFKYFDLTQHDFISGALGYVTPTKKEALICSKENIGECDTPISDPKEDQVLIAYIETLEQKNWALQRETAGLSQRLTQLEALMTPTYPSMK
jgi:hypothetical protein